MDDYTAYDDEYSRRRRAVLVTFSMIATCALVCSFLTYTITRSYGSRTNGEIAIPHYTPLLPNGYRKEKFDTIVVLGDASALGVFDASAKQVGWSSLLLNLLDEKGQRLMKCTDGSNCGTSLAAQLDDVTQLSPTGKIPGHTAVIIQAGADALIECIATRSCTAENVAAQITTFIVNMTSTASRYFSAGEPEVYVFDYPDGTTGSGFIASDQLACTVPFLKTPVSGAVGYFNSLSQVLASSAQQHGFAFMPLRFALARHGAQRDYVLATSAASLKRVDVLGVETESINDHVFLSCMYLAQLGQLFQAQLAYAFLARQEFTQAY